MNKILLAFLSLLSLIAPAVAQKPPVKPPVKPTVIGGNGERGQEVSIDPLFAPGKLWSNTDVTVEAEWKKKGFKWNSETLKDHGIIRRENWGFGTFKITAFAGARNVEEVSFGFKTSKLTEVDIAIWNKGDSKNADMSEKDFNDLVMAWSTELNRLVAPKYEDRGRDSASAARAERRMWVGSETLAQLEYSGGKEKIRDPYSGREKAGKNFQGEFIRLRLMPKPTSTIGLNTTTGGAATVRRADLAKSVVHEPSGDVFIPNVPMVDQGDKGYCAVATAARLLNYYGVPVDQHEMAQIAGTQAGGGGTNPEEMEAAMKKISGKYKTNFQVELDLNYSSRKYQSFMRKYNSAAKKLGKKVLDTNNFIYFISGLDSDVLREVNGQGPALDKFLGVVRQNIDKGVPVMWALQLGKYPENGEPAKQFGGGHVRLIIGYNTAKNEIIFSDSWGAGHEKKRMAAADASACTMGLYLLQPTM